MLLICLLWMCITYLLFKCSNKMDKYILLIGLIGQFILLIGILTNNNYMIELAHILYWIVIIYGTCFFKNKYNIIYILFSIIVTIFTRYYYNECLFVIANNNTKIYEYNNINIEYICSMLIIIIIIRLFNLSHQ
uniref:Uncharacterized protein n=1 Tax=viral metagenome TaxID=1070528 RepID=A0A6C0CXM6_9ZZZZ